MASAARVVEVTTGPVPGWYDDPVRAGRLRWWDGSGWTEHELVVKPEVIVLPVRGQDGGAGGHGAGGHGAGGHGATGSTATGGAGERTGGAVDGAATAAATADRHRTAAPESDPHVADPHVADPHAAAASTERMPSASTPLPDPEDEGLRWQHVPTAGTAPEPLELTTVPTEWNSVSAFLMGFTPWVYLVSAGGIASLGVLVVDPLVWMLVVGVLPLFATWAFARGDRYSLEKYGYEHPPSLWWVLLGPLGYLAIRTLRVRAEAGHGSAPLWVLIANIGAAIVCTLLVGTIIAVAAALIPGLEL